MVDMSTTAALHATQLQFEQLALDWHAVCVLLEAAESARLHVERGDLAPWWNARRIVLTRAARRLSREIAMSHTRRCCSALAAVKQAWHQSSDTSLRLAGSREQILEATRCLERKQLPALPPALVGDSVEDLPLQQSDVELDFAATEVAGLCLDLQQPYRAYLSLLEPRQASGCSYLHFLRMLAALPQASDLVGQRSASNRCEETEQMQTLEEKSMLPQLSSSANIRNSYTRVLLSIHQYLMDFARRAMPWLSPADWHRIQLIAEGSTDATATESDRQGVLHKPMVKDVDISPHPANPSTGDLDQDPPMGGTAVMPGGHEGPLTRHEVHQTRKLLSVNWRAIETHLGALLGSNGQAPFQKALMRTIRYVERKQSCSLEERTFASIMDQVTVEDIAYERNGQWFLRPLPVVRDEKKEALAPEAKPSSSSDEPPMPAWLRRAFALHQVYRCEICEPQGEYRGPLAYERHFRSSAHLRGLHRLGITYSADWNYIDTVADALCLKAHLDRLHTAERYSMNNPKYDHTFLNSPKTPSGLANAQGGR